ncbi:MAG: hypothetical protein ACR2LI_02610 [Propionibacteriaceae bacterium]
MFVTRARALLAAAVCASTLALTGCAGGAPGVAAEVGDKRITESQVNRAYDGVQQAFGTQAQVNKQAVIDALIRGVICDGLAAQRNITITDAERDARLTGDASGEKLLAVAAAKGVAYDLADEQIIAEKLGADAYTKQLATADVTVNPRYGTWTTVNGQTGLVAKPGSLSSPAATPTPAG